MTVENIMVLSERLELNGVNHPILESAMVFAFGIDWEKEPIYRAFYAYAKKAMYFDTVANTWLDK